ncbi:MAG: antitoxin MazE family protein [Betaproteobacteria bacterium]
MRAYRERLRRQGLRPVQVWLPDVRSRRFAAQARRQSLLVSRHSSEAEILRHIERAADTTGWKG